MNLKSKGRNAISGSVLTQQQQASRRGRLTEIKVIGRLLELGETIAKPLQVEAYDVVVIRNGRAIRVQIKTAWESRQGVIKFQCTSNHYGSYENLIDVFVVYNPGSDQYFWVPWEVVGNADSCELRLNPPFPKQPKMKFAADFELCDPKKIN